MRIKIGRTGIGFRARVGALVLAAAVAVTSTVTYRNSTQPEWPELIVFTDPATIVVLPDQVPLASNQTVSKKVTKKTTVKKKTMAKKAKKTKTTTKKTTKTKNKVTQNTSKKVKVNTKIDTTVKTKEKKNSKIKTITTDVVTTVTTTTYYYYNTGTPSTSFNSGSSGSTSFNSSTGSSSTGGTSFSSSSGSSSSGSSNTGSSGSTFNSSSSAATSAKNSSSTGGSSAGSNTGSSSNSAKPGVYPIRSVAPKAPANVLSVFEKMGFKIEVVSGVVYAGCCNTQTRAITLKDIDDTIYHELGHFVAWFAGVADVKQAISRSYANESSRYTAYNRAYVCADQMEYFAESFKNYCLDPVALRQQRPETYDTVVKAINATTTSRADSMLMLYSIVW